MKFINEFKKNKTLFFMALPAVLLVFLLNYIPMSGIILAFKDYKYNLGVFGSPWGGLENFRFFFLSGTGLRVTWNTLYYNTLNLITTQFMAIVLAIILNELTSKLYKKWTQSIIFLPYFISWIIVGVFVTNIFNYDSGLFNIVLEWFGKSPIDVYSKPSAWVPIIVIFNAWKWVGYNSVIYIAAITNLDMKAFEAADIDGANVFQKIYYITLPSIKPTIITMLLLHVGRILRGDFQMFYQIVGNNGQLFDATDVIDTFVFRSLVTSGDLGMSAAATFYQSILCFLIISVVNQVVRKINPENALY